MQVLTTLLTRLTRLGRAPLLLALLLTIPLWLLLDNVVVALLTATLLAFLAAMLSSLLAIHTTDAPDACSPDTTPMTADPDSYTLLPSPAMPTGLPQPDADALAHVHAVQTHLRQRIAAHGGFLPFDQWMQETLYAPGLGYYAASATQFGAQGGDFTTAPELTPLFGRSLAAQVAQVLRESGSLHVLEFGAGSGALAASLIPALRDLGIEPHYHILEVSAALRERQQARLNPLHARVQWRDGLPNSFMGCVIANEVLDAMPATMFRWDERGQLMMLGVVCQPDPVLPGIQTPRSATRLPHRMERAGVLDQDVSTRQNVSPAAPYRAFALAQRPAPQALHDTMTTRMPPLPGYRSECNVHAEAWVRQLGAWLHTGAALLIDYGFSRHTYYHPQRADGTLMCHFRHIAHGDPLIYPGLQDITTHVDFTAMADAALTGGLDILGCATQARFLMNCGILAHLAEAQSRHAATTAQTAQQSAAVQTLLSEAEMGELFKVLALGRGMDVPLLGFAQGDSSHTL